MRRWLDRILVNRLLAGDPAAARRFVDEQYPRVYRFLRFLTRAGGSAEDLTQQTFLKAWQALPGYEGSAALSTWLEKIAYREYAQWRRAHREAVPLDAAGEMADTRAGFSADALAVDQALRSLPPEQEEACRLFYLLGLSVAEIAMLLDLPSGTVKSRLYAARRRLRELLDDPEEELDEPVSSRAAGRRAAERLA